MKQRLNYKINGMTCALCSASIEACLEKLDGIQSVSVGYASEKAVLEYDDEIITPDQIAQKIRQLGFAIDEDGQQRQDAGESEISKRAALFIIAAILTVPTLMCMISCSFNICDQVLNPVAHPGAINYFMYYLHNWKIQFACATPVQFIIGATFYRSAFYSLRARRPTMDVLVVLGSSAAYFYSVYVVIRYYLDYLNCTQNIYLDASCTIITFVLLGRLLEALAKARMSASMRALMDLKPKTARVLRNGEETYILIDQVRPGDIVVVHPGEKLPADGVITEGFSTVDESMLTGENLPVEKSAGDSVFTTSFNKNGSFKFQAEKVGDHTLYAGILKYVENAQNSKAAVQRMADKAVIYFIPVVILAALLTFLVWYIIIFKGQSIEAPLLYAISVLVVSCPCALGLATPTAIIVGIGMGAERGILFKDGEALETLNQVDAVIFDKTGTLTEGKPVFTDMALLRSESFVNAKELLALAGAAERHSEHPLGKALYEKAQTEWGNDLKDPEWFTALPGMGIDALVDGKRILIGNLSCLEDRGIQTKDMTDILKDLEGQGKTAVVMVVDNEPAAVFAFADQLRHGAEAVIRTCQKMGIEVYMVTGDSQNSARSIASQAGITRVLAQVLPERKADEIRKLQQQGLTVAMVGDGINDAPALALADVGIAMGGGTDVAMEAGSIILLHNSLEGLPDAFNLARRTIKKIVQNLLWAFLYNTAAIAFAVTGNLGPQIGALAMAFSSVTVLLNSLSLKRYRWEDYAPLRERGAGAE